MGKNNNLINNNGLKFLLSKQPKKIRNNRLENDIARWSNLPIPGIKDKVEDIINGLEFYQDDTKIIDDVFFNTLTPVEGTDGIRYNPIPELNHQIENINEIITSENNGLTDTTVQESKRYGNGTFDFMGKTIQ